MARWENMDKIRLLLMHEWPRLVIPLGTLLLTLVIGLGAKRVLFGALRRWTAGARSQAGRILTEALEGPFMIWMLILGVHLAAETSALPPRAVEVSAAVLKVLWILSFTIVATRLAGNLVRYYGTGVQGVMPVTTLTQNLAQLAVIILGLLLLLGQLGIPITPILTALGVGGLAVALALQDTLSNLFAGFYVTVAGQVRLGDYIKLNTGEEGYITDITWRSTTIRSLGNNLIVIPNAKLGQAVVTNYHLPEKRMSAQVQVHVGYTADPDQVERILVEEARAALAELPGLLADPAPAAQLDPGFGESGLGFTLNFHVREFADQYAARHVLRKRILRRFREEGIEMPYPTRTIFVREKSA